MKNKKCNKSNKLEKVIRTYAEREKEINRNHIKNLKKQQFVKLATDKQKSYMRFLKILFSPDITLEQAKILISEKLRNKNEYKVNPDITQEQIEQLKEFDIDGSSMSKYDASILIAKLFSDRKLGKKTYKVEKI